MPHKLGNGFQPFIENFKARTELDLLLGTYGFKTSGEDLAELQLEMTRVNLLSKNAVKLFGDLTEYAKKFAKVSWYSENRETVTMLLSYCNKRAIGRELTVEIDIIGETPVELMTNLQKALNEVGENTVINLSPGVYSFGSGKKNNKGKTIANELVVRTKNLTIKAAGDVTIDESLMISASNISLSGITFSEVIVERGGDKIMLSGTNIDKLSMTAVSDVKVENSLIMRTTLNQCDEVSFDHCTLVSNGVAPALSLPQSKVELSNSIIYSRGTALALTKLGTERIIKAKLKNSLIFGEMGFLTVISAGQNKQITRKVDTRQFLSTISVHYELPDFTDPENDDYTLKPTSPGAGKAADCKDLGIIR